MPASQDVITIHPETILQSMHNFHEIYVYKYQPHGNSKYKLRRLPESDSSFGDHDIHKATNMDKITII